ncbi:aldehyde dehydrogenase family protein [Chryseobacterium taichungense]|uniref:aldehyde dehydrogenase family protein n=1 Tax=Chryseobacterium taichungense TaxID=295069 RepID=UPI0028B193CF|nr:aldehyde dehydrogenase family protein [Chryseobacterium taichungense]
MNQNEIYSIQELFETQKKYSFKQRLTTAEERIGLLQKLKNALPDIYGKVIDALSKDVAKPVFEIQYMELAGLSGIIDGICANLAKWMEAESVTSAMDKTASLEIIPEARGVVLVIGPWNVPFFLAIEPMITALAAGNCVMIKPSELTPYTSHVIAEFIPTVFPPEIVSVVEGGVEETTELLKLPFDHIFFTGSPNVGKIVMAAAAKNLTTVTLELGGKSPVFIDESADMERTAASIMHKKTINGGQICISTDYLLVHKSRENELLAALKKYTEKYYYANGSFNGKDMSHIINRHNYDRLKGLYQDALDKGAHVEFGGVFHDDNIQIEPTVLTHVSLDSKIMQEEIFGPLLPVLTYGNLQEAIDYVNTHSKPLALYIYSQDQKNIDKIVAETSSGGVTINDAMLHASDYSLPFGGINGSGMGAYHGVYGFRELSHLKPVYKAGNGPLDETLHPPFAGKVQSRKERALS